MENSGFFFFLRNFACCFFRTIGAKQSNQSNQLLSLGVLAKYTVIDCNSGGSFECSQGLVEMQGDLIFELQHLKVVLEWHTEVLSYCLLVYSCFSDFLCYLFTSLYQIWGQSDFEEMTDQSACLLVALNR